MIPQRAADQQHITGANLLRPPANVRRDGADAGGVNKQLIRRAARTTLVSPVTMAIPAARGGVGHAGDHRFQGGHLQPLFENKAAGKIARDGAADRHIVGGAADASLPILPPERTAGQSRSCRWRRRGGPLGGERRQIEARLILLLCQPGVGEGLHKQVADQLLHCLSPATVG